MKYSETVTYTMNAGAISTQLFRANGTYDPNYSGAGHQPYGRDLLTPYFERYRVIKSYMRIRPLDAGASQYCRAFLTTSTVVNVLANRFTAGGFPGLCESVPDKQQLEIDKYALIRKQSATIPYNARFYYTDKTYQESLVAADPTYPVYFDCTLYNAGSIPLVQTMQHDIYYFVEYSRSVRQDLQS